MISSLSRAETHLDILLKTQLMRECFHEESGALQIEHVLCCYVPVMEDIFSWKLEESVDGI